MSGSQPPPGPGAAGAASGNDPSMEDILASIRRILSEDEAPAAGGTAPRQPAAEPGDDVLLLDPSMMVPEPAPAVQEAPMAELTHSVPEPVPQRPPAASGLVAPEAAAAAASSVGGLMRALATERSVQVRSGGPTLEDLVREEIRPMLKEWLDINLPPLVERLVRTEIERVVGRAVP